MTAGPEAPVRQSLFERVFVTLLLIKGLDGVLEIVGGILLATVPPRALSGWVATLTQRELSEDPRDFIARHLRIAAVHLEKPGGIRILVIAYLVGHGVVKLLLVVALLRRILWAYPASIAFLALFVLYQAYRFTVTHSVALLGLALFDAVLIGLVAREYRRLRAEVMP